MSLQVNICRYKSQIDAAFQRVQQGLGPVVTNVVRDTACLVCSKHIFSVSASVPMSGPLKCSESHINSISNQYDGICIPLSEVSHLVDIFEVNDLWKDFYSFQFVFVPICLGIVLTQLRELSHDFFSFCIFVDSEPDQDPIRVDHEAPFLEVELLWIGVEQFVDPPSADAMVFLWEAHGVVFQYLDIVVEKYIGLGLCGWTKIHRNSGSFCYLFLSFDGSLSFPLPLFEVFSIQLSSWAIAATLWEFWSDNDFQVQEPSYESAVVISILDAARNLEG